jgi:predicted dinucleotide-binding enzyme
MCILILGRGSLAEPIARLAERAGVTVQWSGSTAVAQDTDEPLELLIVVSSTSTVQADLDGVRRKNLQDLVVVNATTPSHNERDDSSSVTSTSSGDATDWWIREVAPGARIVRAFASVPAKAFMDLINRTSSDLTPKLAVPLAGDDREAKERVVAFMRQIVVEPFDLGASSAADLLDPGGALWGKALSQVEMLEAVGWLAGDG